MKILRGTIFGGIFYFLTGWLVYGMLTMNYFMANVNQCANRPAGEMVWWSIILSNLLAALLLTLILNWSKAGKATDGLLIGGLVGLLFTAIVDFSFWSMTTMYSNLITIFIEIILSGIVFALMGLVIVLTWGKSRP